MTLRVHNTSALSTASVVKYVDMFAGLGTGADCDGPCSLLLLVFDDGDKNDETGLVGTPDVSVMADILFLCFTLRV